jgi:hypothetical protein
VADNERQQPALPHAESDQKAESEDDKVAGPRSVAIFSDLHGLAQFGNAKLPNKAYDHAAEKFMRGLGDMGGDIADTARHLVSRLLALGRDRFDRWFDEVTQAVPPDRRRAAPPEIVGPALQELVFMEEKNPLSQLYLELLKKATDKATPESALHPGFTKILGELSPQEAWALYLAKKENVIAKWELPANAIMAMPNPNLSDLKKEKRITFITGMERVYELNIYHLIALNMLKWLRIGSHHPLGSTGRATIMGLGLSEFGRAFVDTCIPEDFNWPQSDGDTQSPDQR